MRFKKALLQQLRKVRFVADWLDIRRANREQKALDLRHRSELEGAKRKNAGRDELDAIYHDYGCEYGAIWDPIYVRQSNKLAAQARKYGVRVSRQPNDYEDENEDWGFSQTAVDWYLKSEAIDRLKREIRIERRQSFDEFRKWVTVAFAFLAWVLGIISLWKKDKQPDPCPKNYYRSDAGDCVYALQKTEPPPPQQQGTPHPLSTSPKKPSPAIPRP
jgi:hypothetical protein